VNMPTISTVIPRVGQQIRLSVTFAKWRGQIPSKEGGNAGVSYWTVKVRSLPSPPW